MKNFYVYQLRLENSAHPFYIGKGHGRRIECHFQESSLRRHNHKNHTIKKAMAQGIKVMPEILHENLTEEQALSKEVELILLYGRRSEGGLLTNKALGGGGSFGYRHTDEAKKKMSIAQKGRKHGEAAKAKISAAFRGKPKNPESVSKMIATQTGRRKTPEAAKAIKFGSWNKNPAWLSASSIYEIWIANGKPGRVKLDKLCGFGNLERMRSAFSLGWIPAEDPIWLEYSSTSLGD